MTQAELQERFIYDDGKLFYRHKVRGHSEGEQAGFWSEESGLLRRHITIKGKRRIHARIVYVYHHGEIPRGKTIDHINRDSTDDHIENLRPATRQVQILNRSCTQEKQSGVTGVVWDKARSKWSVWITIEGKRKQVGRYVELEEAIKVRNSYP